MKATIRSERARAAVISELNAQRPLHRALSTVCELLRASTDSETALIVVAESEMSKAFLVHAGRFPDIDAGALLHGCGPLGAAFNQRSPSLIHARPLAGTPESVGRLREIWATPLHIPGANLGVIAVANRSRPFLAADVGLLSSTAEQMAFALERYRVLAVVQREASTDDLTGLHNHRFLVDYLEQQMALAERLATPLAVLVADIDNFKLINDSHGHPAGDAALHRFAQVLSGNVRRSDLAARYAGDEFVVVMSNTTSEQARVVAEKIRLAAAHQSVSLKGPRPPFRLTVSIGGAAYPGDTESAADLLRVADEALYEAKRLGRDRVAMAADRVAVAARGEPAQLVRR